MSIYRDTNSDVVFEHPFPGPLTATVDRDGTTILTSGPLTPTAGRYTLSLTYRETQYDGSLTVTWTGDDAGTPFIRTQTIDVVTPLVPISTLRPLFTDTNWSDAELAELENNVRLAIQAYTGQTFGYEVSTKYVMGTGEKRIALPSRLARLDAVVGGPIGYFSPSTDGWSLYIINKNLLDVKEAPPEEYIDNKVWVGGEGSGVIYVPDTYWRQFRYGAQYQIEGAWGYPSVPDKVQEAALLLAKDYASPENLYRDRYLSAIKAGDWQLTYNIGAYRGTGNPRADALLQAYIRQGMVII